MRALLCLLVAVVSGGVGCSGSSGKPGEKPEEKKAEVDRPALEKEKAEIMEDVGLAMEDSLQRAERLQSDPAGTLRHVDYVRAKIARIRAIDLALGNKSDDGLGQVEESMRKLERLAKIQLRIPD